MLWGRWGRRGYSVASVLAYPYVVNQARPVSYWELLHAIEWLIVELVVAAEIPIDQFRAELGLPELTIEIHPEIIRRQREVREMWDQIARAFSGRNDHRGDRVGGRLDPQSEG